MLRDTRLSLTPIRQGDFEPQLRWDDPLEKIRGELRQDSEPDTLGANGYRKVPAGNPDEEGYDRMGERTFELRSPHEIFDGINQGGLQGDLFGQGLEFED